MDIPAEVAPVPSARSRTGTERTAAIFSVIATKSVRLCGDFSAAAQQSFLPRRDDPIYCVLPADAGTHDHGSRGIDSVVAMGPGSRPLRGLGRDDEQTGKRIRL